MAHRFTLDPRSFEQFLAAASLLQQFQRQATQDRGPQNFAHHLLELLETQKAIENGALDTDIAVERIVRLALRVLGGEGTAVWVFSNEEFVYRAGSGRSAAKDERLRLTVLARVAAICEPSRESFPGQREWAKGAGDSGYYPGCVRSLIVGPIYQNHTVVGALAAFSSGFDVFDERDAGNIRLLSGLIGSAMERAAVPDTKTVALPRQTLLRVIEHIVPTLERLVHEQDSAQHASPTAAAETPVFDARDEQFPRVTSAEEVPTPDLCIPTVDVSNPAIQADAQSDMTIQPILQLETQKALENRAARRDPEESSVPVELSPRPELIIEPVAQSEEQQSGATVNAAALRDELAQLSRSIAEIDNEEEPAFAFSAPEVRADADEADGDLVAEDAISATTEEAAIGSASLSSEGKGEPELEQAIHNEPYRPMDDTAVPGIGVRAALYDDEEEQPSQVWLSLRAAVKNSAQFVGNAARKSISELKGTASSAANTSRNLGTQVRSKAQWHVSVPKFPTAAWKEAAGKAGTRFSDRASHAKAHLHSISSRKLVMPKIPTQKLRALATEAGLWFRRAARAGSRVCNATVNLLPDLSSFSSTKVSQPRANAATAVQGLQSGAHRVQNFRLRIRINGMALRRSVSALAILLVMSAFLTMQSGLFRSDATAAASARTEVQTKSTFPRTAEPPASSHPAPQTSNVTAHVTTPVRSGPTSHLAITDPSTEDIVQNLTRFEVATLRRQAMTGDEEAAFQLGMAYETGYDMKQNCSKAAEWVTRAAEAGYAPAQYNLGLRYRDGDGVTANTADAERWLNKAAARKYRPARVALAKLLPQER